MFLGFWGGVFVATAAGAALSRHLPLTLGWYGAFIGCFLAGYGRARRLDLHFQRGMAAGFAMAAVWILLRGGISLG